MTEERSLKKVETKVGGLTLSQVIEHQLWKDHNALAQHANLTFAPTALDALQPNYKPALAVVHVDTSPTSKDTYPVDGGCLGLSKHIIMRIASQAGIVVKSRKTSPPSDIDNIEFEATATGKLPDGTPVSFQAHGNWNWEVCKQTKSEKQQRQERKFANQLAETQAILRALRDIMSLKGGYTKAEIAKPFLVARAVFSPDMTDPETKRAVLAAQMHSQVSIYSDETMPALDAPIEPTQVPDEEEYQQQAPSDTIDAEFDPVAGDSSEEPAEAPAEPEEAEPSEDEVKKAKLQRFCIVCKEAFPTDDDRIAYLTMRFKKTSRKDLSVDELTAGIEELSGWERPINIDTRLRIASKAIGGSKMQAICKRNGRATLQGESSAIKMVVLQDAFAVMKGELQL